MENAGGITTVRLIDRSYVKALSAQVRTEEMVGKMTWSSERKGIYCVCQVRSILVEREDGKMEAEAFRKAYAES